MLKKIFIYFLCLNTTMAMRANNTPIELSQARQIRSDYEAYCDKELNNTLKADNWDTSKVWVKSFGSFFLGVVGMASIMASCKKLNQLYHKKCEIKAQEKMRADHASLKKERELSDKLFISSKIGTDISRYITKPFVGTHQNIKDAYIAKNIRGSMDRLSASAYNREIDRAENWLLEGAGYLCLAAYLKWEFRQMGDSGQRFNTLLRKLEAHPGYYLQPSLMIDQDLAQK